MCSTMSFFIQRHVPATGRLAFVLAVATLAGCARAPIRLDVSPSRGPTIGAAIGPLTVAGALGAEGIGVRVTSGAAVAGRRRWSPPPAVASVSGARVLATFDCSGFVQFVFSRHGVELPRTSYQQASAGRAAPREIAALQPGDLMFFATEGWRVDHVAIYAGDGRIIHASAGSGRVRYDDIDTDRGEWFLKRFVTSRRVLTGV